MEPSGSACDTERRPADLETSCPSFLRGGNLSDPFNVGCRGQADGGRSALPECGAKHVGETLFELSLDAAGTRDSRSLQRGAPWRRRSAGCPRSRGPAPNPFPCACSPPGRSTGRRRTACPGTSRSALLGRPPHRGAPVPISRHRHLSSAFRSRTRHHSPTRK